MISVAYLVSILVFLLGCRSTYPGSSKAEVRHDRNDCMFLNVEMSVRIQYEVPAAENLECLHW